MHFWGNLTENVLPSNNIALKLIITVSEHFVLTLLGTEICRNCNLKPFNRLYAYHRTLSEHFHQVLKFETLLGGIHEVHFGGNFAENDFFEN